jgi:hypothetical protein
MPVSRRTLIAASGMGLSLVAAGGFWRVSRTPQTALTPWALDPEPPADPRLDAFRHAILAPNPHNRQPWLIRLDGDAGATLFCDLSRRLPETDPFDRQIIIGFGCFLELARIAAARRGFALSVTPFPEGEPDVGLDTRPIARVHFPPGGSPDPLYPAIPARRSTKTVFEPRAPSPTDIYAVLRWADVPAGHSIDPSLLTDARAEILRAIRIETRLPRTHRESVDVMRIGAREIDANPDGIDVDGPMIEAFSAVGLLNRQSLVDPASSAFASTEQMLADTYGSIPALMWVSTATNSRLDQLEAGSRYARLNLAATRAGLAMHPMSQSLQEYAEMAGPFARIHQLLAPNGGRVQMLARIGYAAAVPPSPRWPLSAKLIPSN